MLVEQITEFKLRGLGPSGCTGAPKTGYFHYKAIISEANLRLNYYLQVKIVSKNIPGGNVPHKILPKNAKF